MTFKDQMTNDMGNVFLNSDEFAEDIIYTPYNDNAKNIKAVIERERLQPDGLDNGQRLSRQAEIYISNDPVTGITEVTKGQDVVLMQKFEEVNYLQDTNGNYIQDTDGNYIVLSRQRIQWVVVDILQQDQAGWRLLIQR
jgi:multidrug efflux pump subunit AcrB